MTDTRSTSSESFPLFHPQQHQSEDQSIFYTTSSTSQRNHRPFHPSSGENFGQDYRPTSSSSTSSIQSASPGPSRNDFTNPSHLSNGDEDSKDNDRNTTRIGYRITAASLAAGYFQLLDLPPLQADMECEIESLQTIRKIQVDESKPIEIDEDIPPPNEMDCYDEIDPSAITDFVSVLRSTRTKKTNIYRSARQRKNKTGNPKHRGSERSTMEGMDMVDELEIKKDQKAKMKRKKRKDEKRAAMAKENVSMVECTGGYRRCQGDDDGDGPYWTAGPGPPFSSILPVPSNDHMTETHSPLPIHTLSHPETNVTSHSSITHHHSSHQPQL